MLRTITAVLKSGILKDRLAVFSHATLAVWMPKLAGGDPALVVDDKVKELGQRIEAKREEAQQAWTKFDGLRTEIANADIDASDTESEAFKKAEDAHKAYSTLAEELAQLEGAREAWWSMAAERGKTEPGSPERSESERYKELIAGRMRESYGQRIVAGELYKQAQASGIFTRNGKTRVGEVHIGEMMDRAEFHALITGADATSAGAFLAPDRRGFVAAPNEPLFITDLITVGTTDSDTVEVVVETSFTNAAAEVGEATSEGVVGDGTGGTVTAAAGGVKPQSAIDWEKVPEPVQTIAHWVATTRRALADAGQLSTLIDGRLRFGLLQRLQREIVAGDGVGDNLLGILNRDILSQPKGTDSLIDATHKAMTKVRLAFLEPSAVGYHPNDWEGIRLAKDANGNYIYGPPAYAGPATAWGLPTSVQAAFPEGNPLVGDFRQAELYIREGVQVLASDSHADFFVRNLIALLAEMRAALGLPLPHAFCEVTTA